ncbi:MAG: ABC transporter substrate-binding protein [Xanthobacteraceae bacterium]|nr:ABC transporter substrate-binding protein [Xanthobacteraceae bacterium]
MIDRRRVVKGGLAAVGSLAAPTSLLAQARPPVKVRYNEVVRSLLYAPAYVAITKGFFKDAGLDVTLTTAFGGDKSTAALLSNTADIALIGPETAIYVLNSDSSSKIRIFCGLTSTDGFMLVGRDKVDKFDWKMLKGKEILGFRPGSTPLLFLEEALRMNGIDPQKDVKLNNNVAIPARVGSWLAGQNQYAIFIEPDAAQLELDGKAHFLASIGQTVGFADYTSFMATDQYIKDNPGVVQTWTDTIYKAQKWTETAKIPELVSALEQFFPGISPKAMAAAAERYQKLKIWKNSPVIEPAAIDKFQDILVNGNVLEKAKRVKFQDLVRTEFASKAK